MNYDRAFSLGAEQSPYDPRTVQHEMTLASPLTIGGVKYNLSDIQDQSKVGICTAISLTQNASKYFGIKFSADFQYLLQKKYIDGNWIEGSSIFSSLKVGKNFGFLPAEQFTFITEADRNLSYPQYVAKLQAIPDIEIAKLLSKVSHRLTGYAQITVNDPQLIAKAINDSKVGILCRYTVGSEWWTDKNGKPSWKTADINPIRPPKNAISGHAIGASYFNFTVIHDIYHPNTWGTDWNDENGGNCNIDWDAYKMTEAWIPYYDFVPNVPEFSYRFAKDIRYNENNKEVSALQTALKIDGVFPLTQPITGFYGDITRTAVLAFQKKYALINVYEATVLRGKLVGPKTRVKLNDLFDK